MSELELALGQLGRELEYPETPDLTESIQRRLAEGRRPRSWRRPLVIALAVLVVALAAVMAVPQARSHILDWLGIGSVTIRYVDDLPTVEKATGELGLGQQVSLSEARDRVPFSIKVPTIEGLDDPKVYVREDIDQVSFLYGSEDDPRLLITQIMATGAMDKLVQDTTEVELVREGDAFGAWLEGGYHMLFYPSVGAEDPQRLVGNVLVLEAPNNVTTRVEAQISKDEALRIFRSMR
jgi:hypothetical protein